MHREGILKYLVDYQPTSSDEMGIVERFTHFVTTTPDCFERTHTSGHITGSSFILSSDRRCVLLAFHAKLRKWLQLGGHADGCPDTHDVARREAFEESGISTLLPYLHPQAPIDFDIHEIPPNIKEGSHLHYDVRYVFCAQEDSYTCSSESLELRWVPFDAISNYSTEPSLLRVIQKIKDTV